MTIALVTSAYTAGNTNGSTTPACNTTGANLLVVTVSWFTGGGTVTVSDSKSNTNWTQLTKSDRGFAFECIWYCKNPTVGDGHTFTVASTGGYASIHAVAFSGADTTAPFDKENGSWGSSVSTQQTGSITPAEDNEVVVYGCSTDNSKDISSVDVGTLLSHNAHTGNSFGNSLAYIIQTTAGAINPTFTLSGSSTTPNAVIASFKVASASGITGTIAATESGSDTAAATGKVYVKGTVAATETGADVLAATGKVTVKGTIAAVETGSDVSAITGKVYVKGALAAVETGSDTASFIGAGASVPVTGTLSAIEGGLDNFAASGNILVRGVMAAVEVGSDTADFTSLTTTLTQADLAAIVAALRPYLPGNYIG